MKQAEESGLAPESLLWKEVTSRPFKKSKLRAQSFFEDGVGVWREELEKSSEDTWQERRPGQGGDSAVSPAACGWPASWPVETQRRPQQPRGTGAEAWRPERTQLCGPLGADKSS